MENTVKKSLVILTGAGISAESGIKTFRDSNGLWENHDVMKVASIDGWRANKELVLDFYNKRRQQLQEVSPNEAHLGLVELEKYFNVSIITQNVDDLHERAGSKNVLHLHGELLKVRSTGYRGLVYEWKKDLNVGDLCEKGSQLRPYIVWFGEEVPEMDNAVKLAKNADIFVIIGTSMQVYPAAGLISYIDLDTPKYYIDPHPEQNIQRMPGVTLIEKNATEGIRDLIEYLIPES